MFKKKIYVILFVICLIGMLLILTGCDSENENSTEKSGENTTVTTSKETNTVGNNENTTEDNDEEKDENDSASSNEKNESEAEDEKESEDGNEDSANNENKKGDERAVDQIDFKKAAEKQMSKPEKGETIAVMHIKDYGDIKFKFFEKKAPKAVENFLTHAREGYYDGLTFHRVIDGFMIQGGDPDGNGTGGESIWGTGFGTELDYELVPYKGSLCMAMSSLPNSIGSQFFITQADYSQSGEATLKSMNFPDGLIEQYKEYGGYLSSLYLQYTVFGQAFEGIDIVDKVASVETNSSDKPLTDVIIEKIDVTTY